MTLSAQEIADGLAVALATYESACADCPFRQRRKPPFSEPCPACLATHQEACRKDVLAAFAFAASARSLLLKDSDK